MFAIKFAVVLTGIVVLGGHRANAACGCGLFKGWRTPSLSSSYGGDSPYSGGLDFLGGSRTWADGRSENGWTETRSEYGNDIVKNCAPLVVRPQEIAKPALPLPASLAPVPGPCACKRAIVKPAILPKPVYRPSVMEGGLMGVGQMGLIGANYNQNINGLSSSSLLSGMGGMALGGVGGGDCSPIILDKNGAYANQANYVPADAVSIALAQKKNQQQFAHSSLSEDRLAFGFRKMPQEIPIQKIVRQNNIPEEKIFSLNGQIVELKPVKVCNQQTLEEEAAEELLALQEEETAALSDAEGRSCAYGSPFRVSLGELGYGPAKNERKSFIDVPTPVIDAAAEAIGEVGEAMEGAIEGAMDGAISSAAGALGLGGLSKKSGGCNAGFAPGNVMYKTIPKIPQISVPTPEQIDSGDCESQEVGEQSVVYDEGCGVTCGTCCMPCCSGMHHNFQKSASSSSSSSSSSMTSLGSKRASVLIEKLCNKN